MPYLCFCGIIWNLWSGKVSVKWLYTASTLQLQHENPPHFSCKQQEGNSLHHWEKDTHSAVKSLHVLPNPGDVAPGGDGRQRRTENCGSEAVGTSGLAENELPECEISFPEVSYSPFAQENINISTYFSAQRLQPCEQ